MSNDDKDENPSRGRIEERDREEFKRRAKDIGKRLDQAKPRDVDPVDNRARGNALGVAFKIAVEGVAGVCVGGFIGWVLDGWLGTKPWLLIVFLVLGFAAGMLNTIRTAQRMQKKSEPLQRAAPSVSDDEDEK